jgi:hypothetical protein
MNDETLLNSLQ